MRMVSRFLVFVVSLCIWSCSGLLVTKNMNHPKAVNLDKIGDPGKEVFKKLNLADSTAPLPPIVAIPGVGGCQLSAKVNRSESNHWYCHKDLDWYLIWLALSELVPGPVLECWSDNMMLNYTTVNGFKNVSGVEIKADYFGSTLGFEYVDPSVPSQSIYFAALVESLLKLGYVRGQNLIGIPYDWRLSPNYMPGLFTVLQQMVEDAYTAANNTKVAFVAHSMGNLFFLTFMRMVSQEWKDKYVLTYIAASPPWVGSVEAIQSLTSGYDFSIPYLPASAAKVVQRTFASNYFLMPYPKYYGNTVFVSTPTTNYTAQNYIQLLSDLGIADMYVPWTLSLNLADPFVPPGVDTYCLYGFNVSTLKQEIFDSNDLSKSPKLVTGDGDGTVPIESLTFCQNWIGQTNYSVSIKGYKGQEHVDLMFYPPFVTDVLNAIMNATIPSPSPTS